MSYILNALKKSEHEREGAGAAPRDRARALNQRLVAGAGPAAPSPPRPRWQWVAGAGGVAIAGLAGLASFLALTGGEPEPPATTAELTAGAAEPDTPPQQLRGEPLVAGAPLLEPPGPVAEPSIVLPRSGGVGRAAAPGPEPTAPSATPVVRPPRVAPTVPVSSMPLAAALPAPRRAVARGETPPGEGGAPPAVVAVAEPAEPPSDGAPATGIAATSGLDPPRPAAAEREPQLEVELAGLPPAAGDAETIRAAALFNDHAWEYERDGIYDSALDAFTRAIRLRPDYAEAYFGRGWVNERLDQLERAVADYGRAIKVRPGFAAAYNNRGVVQIYRNRLEEAERDFEAALAAGGGELRRYAMLWRYVAIERAGGDGRARLAADARKADLGRWPGVLAKFFLGEASAEQVLEDANDRDPILRREKLCVAFFFLGQYHLLRGDPTRAKAFFRDTLATGVSAFVQYGAAERELERLARLR
jgi:lipoprotein NlpI